MERRRPGKTLPEGRPCTPPSQGRPTSLLHMASAPLRSVHTTSRQGRHGIGSRPLANTFPSHRPPARQTPTSTNAPPNKRSSWWHCLPRTTPMDTSRGARRGHGRGRSNTQKREGRGGGAHPRPPVGAPPPPPGGGDVFPPPPPPPRSV